ncbi:deoxyribodipyrimidine photo-lyase [Candidatus Pelagibacter sp. HIMB1321]|uniref:deoxyribodipyrimidine photo-lyase n=1 Tax=Candidatus Pelagibacter sp. HIMB1321 TaxID=1388755 RepID=UPI000A07EA6D|nr:deoxyribodipyrimidine photo-lyase [Candidatus Pelagibacter sp. HIMB1321]SMF77656.1 Deoxyribodipyrimidine photolyase [Candidatus Pelagibacter sp. HIMB1321]
MKKILWFRYDLRIEDNEAFNKACIGGEVLPIFIYDKEYWKLETSSSFHLNFTKESLDELSNEFHKKFNIKLSIFYGNTIEILSKLINEFKITDIFTNQIFRNKNTLDLDQKCIQLFNDKDIKWHQLQQFGIQLENRKRNYWENLTLF